MSQYSKFLILSPPKSGSHMLCRMISRSTNLKWLVTGIDIKIENIINDNWIIAIHKEYCLDIDIFCKKNNICLLGITREIGHLDSIKRDISLNMNINKIKKIKQSIPESINIFYDDLVFNNSEYQLEKIKKITMINNIELEKWEDRYKPSEPMPWRKNFLIQ